MRLSGSHRAAKDQFSTLIHIKKTYVSLKTCRFVDVIHHRSAVKASPVQPFNLMFISSSVSSSCKMSVNVSIPVSLSVCLGQASFYALLLPFSSFYLSFSFYHLALAHPRAVNHSPGGVSSPLAQTYTNGHI